MMRWYEDADGNFVEQFQTTGFDARVWELYLFATLSEVGYVIDRPHPAPDFTVRGPTGKFCLERSSRDRPDQDLVLVEVNLPGGLETRKQLLAEREK